MKNTFDFKIVENIMSKNVLCMIKDSNNIIKWCQIHGVPISWIYKHNYKRQIIVSLNEINGFFFKILQVCFHCNNKCFWFLYCDFTFIWLKFHWLHKCSQWSQMLINIMSTQSTRTKVSSFHSLIICLPFVTLAWNFNYLWSYSHHMASLQKFGIIKFK